MTPFRECYEPGRVGPPHERSGTPGRVGHPPSSSQVGCRSARSAPARSTRDSYASSARPARVRRRVRNESAPGAARWGRGRVRHLPPRVVRANRADPVDELVSLGAAGRGRILDRPIVLGPGVRYRGGAARVQIRIPVDGPSPDRRVRRRGQRRVHARPREGGLPTRRDPSPRRSSRSELGPRTGLRVASRGVGAGPLFHGPGYASRVPRRE